MARKKSSRSRGRGWFKPKTVRVTFEKVGYPQFYVDIIKPSSYLYGDVVAFEGIGPGSPREEVEVALSRVIADWNLTDPRTGEPLPVPSPEDPSPLLALPISFLLVIQEATAEESLKFREEGIPKKVREMQPEVFSEE